MKICLPIAQFTNRRTKLTLDMGHAVKETENAHLR